MEYFLVGVASLIQLWYGICLHFLRPGYCTKKSKHTLSTNGHRKPIRSHIAHLSLLHRHTHKHTYEQSQARTRKLGGPVTRPQSYRQHACGFSSITCSHDATWVPIYRWTVRIQSKRLNYLWDHNAVTFHWRATIKMELAIFASHSQTKAPHEPNLMTCRQIIDFSLVPLTTLVLWPCECLRGMKWNRMVDPNIESCACAKVPTQIHTPFIPSLDFIEIDESVLQWSDIWYVNINQCWCILVSGMQYR